MFFAWSPGEWRVERKDDGSFEIWAIESDFDPVVRTLVATIPAGNEANAYLITKAPQLILGVIGAVRQLHSNRKQLTNDPPHYASSNTDDEINRAVSLLVSSCTSQMTSSALERHLSNWAYNDSFASCCSNSFNSTMAEHLMNILDVFSVLDLEDE